MLSTPPCSPSSSAASSGINERGKGVIKRWKYSYIDKNSSYRPIQPKNIADDLIPWMIWSLELAINCRWTRSRKLYSLRDFQILQLTVFKLHSADGLILVSSFVSFSLGKSLSDISDKVEVSTNGMSVSSPGARKIAKIQLSEKYSAQRRRHALTLVDKPMLKRSKSVAIWRSFAA